MTYKIKSLAYLVAFVAIAFTYHITEKETNNTYTETAELIQTNSSNTISTTTAVDIYKK